MCGIVGKNWVLTRFLSVFEPILEWDPHVLCVGLWVRWIHLREEMDLDYLLAQIRVGLNELLASKVTPLNMSYVVESGLSHIDFIRKICCAYITQVWSKVWAPRGTPIVDGRGPMCPMG